MLLKYPVHVFFLIEELELKIFGPLGFGIFQRLQCIYIIILVTGGQSATDKGQNLIQTHEHLVVLEPRI